MVSRALQNGKISLSDFNDNTVNDRNTEILDSKIKAEPHPKSKPNEKNVYYAESITTKEGKHLRKFVDAPVGRDKDHPLPENALLNKFYDCCDGVLAPEKQAFLQNYKTNLSDISTYRSLLKMPQLRTEQILVITQT